jgi:hypothetical protein
MLWYAIKAKKEQLVIYIVREFKSPESMTRKSLSEQENVLKKWP